MLAKIPFTGFLLVTFCLNAFSGGSAGMIEIENPRNGAAQGKETITLGGGCFWCIEALFNELRGVKQVESGYSGGRVPNPTYERVCTGATGHAEVVQVTFDPRIVTLKELLSVFFTIHDPTTMNRQGADVGTQYRSAIFYRDQRQKETAEQAVRDIDAAHIWNGRIVTEIAPFTVFYRAENYHQEYFRLNGSQPYCRLVIAPKVAKFREHYRSLLK